TVDPPFAVGDLPAAPRPALVPREPCLVCLMPIPPQPTPLGPGTPGKPLPVCPVCWEQARSQHQPINGYIVLKKLGTGGMGFVHRDIKPANLMVTQVNGRETIKLADFGLARVYQASELSGLTMMGDMGGTLAFMAPEQITNFRDAKPAADLYAVAATLYNLIT